MRNGLKLDGTKAEGNSKQNELTILNLTVARYFTGQHRLDFERGRPISSHAAHFVVHSSRKSRPDLGRAVISDVPLKSY
jgi:hypothetical protein